MKWVFHRGETVKSQEIKDRLIDFDKTKRYYRIKDIEDQFVIKDAKMIETLYSDKDFQNDHYNYEKEIEWDFKLGDFLFNKNNKSVSRSQKVEMRLYSYDTGKKYYVVSGEGERISSPNSKNLEQKDEVERDYNVLEKYNSRREI